MESCIGVGGAPGDSIGPAGCYIGNVPWERHVLLFEILFVQACGLDYVLGSGQFCHICQIGVICQHCGTSWDNCPVLCGHSLSSPGSVLATGQKPCPGAGQLLMEVMMD